MSYERGLKLEELLAMLFKSKGYDARRNAKLTGRSGVEHQIDVLAEYRAPLHVSKIIVECKAYDKPIDKNIVMKLIHEVGDLGADRGILVTTSYFTPDAVSTAEGYNIELWDGAKLSEFLKDIPIEEVSVPGNAFYVKSSIPAEEAIRVVDKVLTGLFGKKGSIESSFMTFHPFYELNIDAKIYEMKGLVTKKVEERIVNSTVLIEALVGLLCNYDLKAGVIPLVSLPTISEEERMIFKTLLNQGSITVSALASLMSCSTDKARKLLQGLVAKGIALMVQQGRMTLYQSRVRVPDPSLLTSISSNLKIEVGVPKEGVVVDPKLSVSNVEELVKLLWDGHVKDYKIIYYPYYACKVNEQGKRYVMAVDMQNGKVDNTMTKILTASYSQLPF
jgi:hypothetical protein